MGSKITRLDGIQAPPIQGSTAMPGQGGEESVSLFSEGAREGRTSSSADPQKLQRLETARGNVSKLMGELETLKSQSAPDASAIQQKQAELMAAIQEFNAAQADMTAETPKNAENPRPPQNTRAAAKKSGGFFKSIGDFFSGIFEGIKNIFKSKEPDPAAAAAAEQKKQVKTAQSDVIKIYGELRALRKQPNIDSAAIIQKQNELHAALEKLHTARAASNGGAVRHPSQTN